MKIKGHSTIELTDVESGAKEIYENDNLVTNAVQKFIEAWLPLIGANGIRQYFTPLYSKMYGGIYLFDKTLNASADNMFLPNPATAALVGYAGHATSDGNDTKRGDFNFTESGAISNGYKFVWDFGTDDANGEIAAVSLTNDIAGYLGYTYSPDSAIESSYSNTGNSGYYCRGLGYSRVNDDYGNNTIIAMRALDKMLCYAADMEAKTDGLYFTLLYNESRTRRRKIVYKYQYNILGLNDTPYSLITVSDEAVTIPDENEYIFFRRMENGDFVGIVQGAAVPLVIVDKTTLQTKNAVTINLQAETGRTVQGIAKPAYNCFEYKNGYIYVFTADSGWSGSTARTKVCKINVNSGEYEFITPEIILDSYSSNGNRFFMYKDNNGLINVAGGVLDANDNFIEAKSGGIGAPINAQPYAFIRDFFIQWIKYDGANYTNNNRLYPNLQYLGTINNLAAPVVKTPSKTMKITYTLTYSE